jgi:CRISPR-associated endonuclease Cas2
MHLLLRVSLSRFTTLMTLLVTYDYNKEPSDSDRAKLREKIKSYGSSWQQLSESSYAIETNSTAKTVYEALRPTMDSNDYLFVIPLTKSYWGYGPKAVIAWLDARVL